MGLLADVFKSPWGNDWVDQAINASMDLRPAKRADTLRLASFARPDRVRNLSKQISVNN